MIADLGGSPADLRGFFVWLAMVAFPGTLIGAWLGARVYHALSDKHFGDVVLGLLFLSGATLVWNSVSAF